MIERKWVNSSKHTAALIYILLYNECQIVKINASYFVCELNVSLVHSLLNRLISGAKLSLWFVNEAHHQISSSSDNMWTMWNWRANVWRLAGDKTVLGTRKY